MEGQYKRFDIMCHEWSESNKYVLFRCCCIYNDQLAVRKSIAEV